MDLVYVERAGSRYRIVYQGECIAYDVAWPDLPYVLEESGIALPPAGVPDIEPT